MQYEKDNFFNIDVNMTEQCSLRCKYCIENFNKPELKNISKSQIEKIKNKIDFLLESTEFRKLYNGIGIFFWGGEPTLNFDGMKSFIEYYKNNNRVQFYIYSNGYKLNHLYEYLKEIQNLKVVTGNRKISLQISYDGLASHNIDRVNINGKGSALKVKQTMFELKDFGVDFHIHPTLAFKNFDKIADNYLEFERLSKTLNNDIIYNPTIDYLSNHNFTFEELEDIKKIITQQIKKIKPNLIEYYKKYGIFNLGWLNESKSLCGAGFGMQAIDIDGSVYPCHGSMNSSKKLESSNLEKTNEEYLEDIINNYYKFKEAAHSIPKECKECYSTYCMKCNSKKYELSNKEFKEAWSDYPNQPHLCEVYRHFTILRFALLKLIEKSDI